MFNNKSFLLIFSLINFLFSQDVVINLDGSNLLYTSSVDIAGFQFNHDGCAINASGGAAELAGLQYQKVNLLLSVFLFQVQ